MLFGWLSFESNSDALIKGEVSICFTLKLYTGVSNSLSGDSLIVFMGDSALLIVLESNVAIVVLAFGDVYWRTKCLILCKRLYYSRNFSI